MKEIVIGDGRVVVARDEVTISKIPSDKKAVHGVATARPRAGGIVNIDRSRPSSRCRDQGQAATAKDPENMKQWMRERELTRAGE